MMWDPVEGWIWRSLGVEARLNFGVTVCCSVDSIEVGR